MKFLIFISVLIILVIIIRLVFVAFSQKKEFSYHKDIPKSIKLWSDDFQQNETIPTKFTGQGNNLSPSLHWDNLPAETKSLALIVTDYDAPSPIIKITTIDHWVVYNIAPDFKYFDEALSSQKLIEKGMSLGTNITGGTDYVGPNPPFGTHDYYFRIYALSVSNISLIKPTKKALMEEMKNNIIAYGELIGKYKK